MHFDTATRQRWMRALAYSNADALNVKMQALKLTPEYELIRAPETGLMQIQARMGGTGNRFFAGDTTLTRAVVRLKSGHAGLQLPAGAQQTPRRAVRRHRRAVAGAHSLPDLNGNLNCPAGGGTRRTHYRSPRRSKRQPGRLLYAGTRR
ncbi:phosphonate C-P lyase system protein PhnG [Citrobacter koseri]|nr:phosphonate C-P lyase system protein PhnG [Citrobacter koseri]